MDEGWTKAEFDQCTKLLDVLDSARDEMMKVTKKDCIGLIVLPNGDKDRDTIAWLLLSMVHISTRSEIPVEQQELAKRALKIIERLFISAYYDHAIVHLVEKIRKSNIEYQDKIKKLQETVDHLASKLIGMG